jgi:cytochrome c553
MKTLQPLWPHFRFFLTTCLATVLVLGWSNSAQADQKKPRTLAEQLIHDVKEGKIQPDEEDEQAVQELIIKRNIPITYQYVNTLMHTPNAFGPGAACVTCHSSQDANKSYRGLNLSTCKGLHEGSTEEPKRVLFTPGTDPKRDPLIRRLRNNRKNVGPLFKKANAFAPNSPACTACHMSNQEPPSFHELDLTSYKGVMLGADSVAKGVDKATKVVIPGMPDLSGLWQHLAEDRMPPGISPAENREHANTLILMQWIKQGASCN